MSFFADGYGSFGGLVFPDVTNNEANLLIIGVPYEGAISGKQGTSQGPSEIRNICRDMQTITRRSVDLNQLILKDLGDVEVFPTEAEKTRQSIRKAYNQLFMDYNSPVLTIGGDHSITYPIVKGFQADAKIGIVWFDAHRDLLEKLIGSRYSHGSSLRRITELTNVEYENVLLVGTRYMEPDEEKFIQEYKLSEFSTVNEIYGSYVGDKPPARSTVEVSALPAGAQVEIEMIFHIPS